jgi:hypothetical protein
MNVLVSVKTNNDPSLEKIVNALKFRDIDFDIATPPDAYHYLKKRDFIIALGGDGTVLGTSRLTKLSVNSDTPILTVRGSNGSVGALCYYNLDLVDFALNQIKQEKYTVEKWTRVKATCNGSSICGLNEIYIGSEFSVRASKYNLYFKHQKDYQISSGVVISTGTGITGWFKSILGQYPSRFPTDRDSNDLAYIVRELSYSQLSEIGEEFIYNENVIEDGELICIEWMQDRKGVAAADGSFKSAFSVARGDKVVIENAHDPVSVIKCLP